MRQIFLIKARIWTNSGSTSVRGLAVEYILTTIDNKNITRFQTWYWITNSSKGFVENRIIDKMLIKAIHWEQRTIENRRQTKRTALKLCIDCRVKCFSFIILEFQKRQKRWTIKPFIWLKDKMSRKLYNTQYIRCDIRFCNMKPNIRGLKWMYEQRLGTNFWQHFHGHSHSHSHSLRQPSSNANTVLNYLRFGTIDSILECHSILSVAQTIHSLRSIHFVLILFLVAI